MLRHRSFWVILVATAIAWLVFTMSESNEYHMQLRVEWTGYDTSRYVVVSSDTVLPITVTSNCFEAISCYLIFEEQAYRVNTLSDTTLKIGSAFFDAVAQQLGTIDAKSLSSTLETIHFKIVERKGRPYVPQLRDVEFLFADQRGLSGNPHITPDTVWLYGDPVSLSKIPELTTAPATVRNISDSGYVTLALAPVWRKYSDLRASADSVRIFIPVGKYVETTISVPVTFSADAEYQVQLYPAAVKVTLWVLASEIDNVGASQLQAVVVYDPSVQELPVRITRFPANTRIKQVTPSSLQYVIIK